MYIIVYTIFLLYPIFQYILYYFLYYMLYIMLHPYTILKYI
jgi:hypothetical protein